MTARASVLGLDLSLAATGVCWVQPGDDTPDHFTIPTKPAQEIGYRLELVLDQLQVITDVTSPRLAVIELLPTHMKGTGQTGMVHGIVRHHLWNHDVPVIDVPPATLKVWATGRGNATKPDMRMEAFKRLDVDERDDNRVDALWLWTLGAHVLGDPVVDLPQTHLRALDKLDTSSIGVTA